MVYLRTSDEYEYQRRLAKLLGRLQDLVEEALVGLGRTRVARAYILYRDRRSRARATLSVSETGMRGKQAPQVRGEAGVSPWNRSRIAAALVRESGLGGQIAEVVPRAICGGRREGAQLVGLDLALPQKLSDPFFNAIFFNVICNKHR